MAPAKATRPGFRQSLAATYSDSSKNDGAVVNLFHPVYHSYTYPIGSRIDIDREWPIQLGEQDTEDLIDLFSEPPQFVERLSPVSARVGDVVLSGSNWTELMVKVYRRSLELFDEIGTFIETRLRQTNGRSQRVPFTSLAIDPDTLHRIIELDYETGEATYSRLMDQFAEGTLAPCLSTPFHNLLPLLSETEIRLCARISFVFYLKILQKYQEFLDKRDEGGLFVVPFWMPESAFHSRIEKILKEEFCAFCKKHRMGQPHLVFLLDSHQTGQKENDGLMKSWNLLQSQDTVTKNSKNGSRRSSSGNGKGIHEGVHETSVVFRDRIFSDWVVYANPSVKKLLDRTIAKVDSDLNRQEAHYGWAHFEELESLAFSSKSVHNFWQKLTKLTELGYVPLSPDFFVRGKLRGRLGYTDAEPRRVEVKDNSAGADWTLDSKCFSRWQGVESVDGGAQLRVAPHRKYQRYTKDGFVDEVAPQCWKIGWSKVRETCSKAVIGDLATCKGGMAEVLGKFVGGKNAEIRCRNVLDFLVEYTYVYWREHFIQHDLSEADINIHEIANKRLKAGVRGKLSEQDAAIAGAAAQAIFFGLDAGRTCGTRYENLDQRAFYQNVTMLTLALCNCTYVYHWLKDTRKARKIVDIIKTELIGFDTAYDRYKLQKFGVTRQSWKTVLESEVQDCSENLVARAASRLAASHLRPLGYTKDFSRSDEHKSVNVGHIWNTELNNMNYKYENPLYCGVSEA